MKKTLFAVIVLCFLLIFTVRGFTGDVKFRSPISSSYYFSSYYDNNSSTGIKDYLCGTNTYDKHQGTDFAAARYTKIYAAASGDLYYREDGYGDGCADVKKCCQGKGCLGNQVRINHGSGWETYYGHMQKGTVVYWMSLYCGQYLGQVGTSGCSSGPHLHFQVVKYGYPQDDPFAGQCSHSQSFWTSVNNGKPSTYCSY